MKTIVKLLLSVLFIFLLQSGIALGVDVKSLPATDGQTSQDIFYQTPGTIQGPSAAETFQDYSTYPLVDNRLVVWFVTQQHTYFGGFVLSIPLFCLLLEFLGITRKQKASKEKFDGLAHDILRVALLSLSITALLGCLMLMTFVTLYPGFMSYMAATFKPVMPVYATVFVSEAFLLALYYYTWDYLKTPAAKWVHMTLGVLSNATGVLLLLLANSWASFMMAPAGVDAQGHFLGNVWHLLHSPLWNPLNTHRFLADIMSGGAVVVAYATYRFFMAKTSEDRAYYDWVGHVFIVVVVCALLPMPLAGYWLMRSVFEFRQTMGMAMMGGMLSWLFVLQAIMVGVLFLGINYYIWQSLARLQGGERFHPHFKAILFTLMVCFLVWFTPHTIAMSGSEMKAMGAAQHPVIGQFGVMSAKNGAVNVMICLTALSYILYRRANYVMTVSWASKGNIFLMWLFLMGIANIVWLAIYGFYIPANVRVGLSYPQGMTTATVVVGGLLLNRFLLRGAHINGPVHWGRITPRGIVALFVVAAAFTWVMGLMGYIRSVGRLEWHISELMPDRSSWAFTPSLGFAAKMVTLNMIVFWSSVFFVFWLSRRDQQVVERRTAEFARPSPVIQVISEEESA
ncbi:MAG TPA: cytochrome ubiquinol oxidase subunit I [Nitrospirales bacterium]|nr:cytochrome ubiquinol oxidase subunit I [Nitrospirales bacterium]